MSLHDSLEDLSKSFVILCDVFDNVWLVNISKVVIKTLPECMPLHHATILPEFVKNTESTHLPKLLNRLYMNQGIDSA